MAFDLHLAQLIATIALNLSVAVVSGASMSTLWLDARSSSWAGRNSMRLRPVTRVSVTAALLAYVTVLWFEAAAMAEIPITSAASAVYSVLTATHYGFAWTLGACALTIVAGISAVDWRAGAAGIAGVVRLVSIAIFLYSRSIVSHAGAGGDISWEVAADWVHLILISVWVGEVLVAGWIILRQPAGPIHEDRLGSARYIEALSSSATVALIGILATGLVSAWHGLGILDNAVGNPYANTLLIKLALVAGAALLGAINRFFVMPRLLAQLRRTKDMAAQSERRFAFALQVEAALLIAAVVMAAILSSTSRPTAA